MKQDGRLQILKMVEDQKISVEEAMQLLSKLEGDSESKEERSLPVISEQKLPKERTDRGKRKNRTFNYSGMGRRIMDMVNTELRTGRKLVIRVKKEGKKETTIQFPVSVAKPFIDKGFGLGKMITQTTGSNYTNCGGGNTKYTRFVADEDLKTFFDSNQVGTLLEVDDPDSKTYVLIAVE